MKNILELIKVFLLFYMMTFGFWFTYAMIWFAFGLPLETWSLLVLFIPAGLSMYGYYRWIRE